jgi:Zn-dependent protease with chaperone function
MKNFRYLCCLTAFFYLILFLPFISSSQDFDNYKNIQPLGKIPEDFLTLSSSKYEADKAKVSKNENGFIKRSQKQFYLESNFMINELLLNGKVLYNDPLGNYVNKVLNELLAKQPDLRKNIRVYVVLSPIVNAYATDNGTIFVNTGLLAKLQTEAQLAFILGHEITHFEKKHVLNRYVHNEKIQKGKITFSGSEVESQLFLKTTYAKDQEIEADIRGTDILLGTRYNPNAAIEVMNLLGSSIPFDEKYRFDPDFFNLDSTVIKQFDPVIFDSLHIEKQSEIENSTHPALSERITKINNKINAADTSIQDFILPEEEFYAMRKQAQYELSKLYLNKGNHIFAIYSIYQLIKDNPESIYLKELYCKAFYLSAKLAMNADSDREYDNIEISYESKEIQYLYKYLKQMSPAELNALAIMSYLKIYPKSLDFSEEIRLKDLLYDYKNNYMADTASYLKKFNTYISSHAVVQSILSVIPIDNESVKKENQKNNTKEIKNIVVLDPRYKKFDLRKEKQDSYIASEKSLIEYHDQIDAITKDLSIKTTVISPLKLNEDDTQKFQEHSILKNYLEEVFSNGNNIIATDYEKVNQICKQYNSQHIALVGTYSFHLHKPVVAKIGVLLWTGIVLPTLPFGIYYATVPTYRTYTYVLAINTQNQRIDFKDIRTLKFRDSKGAVNSSTCYQLLKMKKRKS